MGVGAKVEVATQHAAQTQVVVAGRGYESYDRTQLHFGLGLEIVQQITVLWSGGKVEVLDALSDERTLILVEGVSDQVGTK